jgi:hypothetical protein
VAQHYASEGSLTINDGEPSVGRPAITEAARSFMVAFPDMRVLMDDLIERESGVEYHWTLVGTNTGPGGTGNRVRISGFEEWTIGDDGLIAGRWATTTKPNTTASSSRARPSRRRGAGLLEGPGGYRL